MSNRARRRSPSEIREQQTTRRLWLGVIGVLAFIALAVASIIIAREHNPQLSETDLCPLDRPPAGDIVILLDATTPWNAVQRAVIANEFSKIQQELGRFTRVHLFALDTSSSAIPRPALSLCNPGTTDDLKGVSVLGVSGARLIGNPATIRERWEDGFVGKLDSILAEQGQSAGSPQSRIMEVIRGAALQVWGGNSEPSTQPRQLYLFSDLLQNSSLYSHYNASSWVAADAQFLADYSQAGTQAMENVQVRAFLLDRPQTRLQNRSRSDLVRFWEHFFDAQGALLIGVRRIEG